MLSFLFLLRLWIIFLISLTLENTDSSFQAQTKVTSSVNPFLSFQGTRCIQLPAPSPHRAEPLRYVFTHISTWSATRAAFSFVFAFLAQHPVYHRCSIHGSKIQCQRQVPTHRSSRVLRSYECSFRKPSLFLASWPRAEEGFSRQSWVGAGHGAIFKIFITATGTEAQMGEVQAWLRPNLHI